jgi:hypothetical protein
MFRFTIRESVLLTLVVAMGVAWWLDHREQAASASQFSHNFSAATEMLKEFGCSVELESGRVVLFVQEPGDWPVANPPQP